jgi:hypothetical protein
MSWLLVTWFLAFGYVPKQTEIVAFQYQFLTQEEIATVAQMGVSAKLFDRFTISGDIENFQYIDTKGFADGGAFFPYRIDYHFSLNVKVNAWLSVIATHECDHSIKIKENLNNQYESSETKVIIRIDGTSNF